MALEQLVFLLIETITAFSNLFLKCLYKFIIPLECNIRSASPRWRVKNMISEIMKLLVDL